MCGESHLATTEFQPKWKIKQNRKCRYNTYARRRNDTIVYVETQTRVKTTGARRLQIRSLSERRRKYHVRLRGNDLEVYHFANRRLLKIQQFVSLS